MKHLDIKVYGRVQGVFFRLSAQTCAQELGIKGFARNEQDGSVYIEAEGKEESLEEFLNWCRNGPESADVSKIDLEEGELRNFEDFEVK